MAIKQFNRASCREVAEKVLAVLTPVAASFGLHVKKSPGSYTDNTYTMKIEFSTIDEEGIPKTGIRRDYMFHCDYFGLKPEWLDKVFILDSTGESYKIIGLKPKSHKYPILAEDVITKKVFKFPAATIKRLLK